MYNYQNSRNGRKRMRGIYGFPWLLFVIIMFNFHSLPWIIMTFFVMGFVFLIIKAVMSTSTTGNAAANGMRAQPTYQPYQPPTPIYRPPYQPPTPVYQPPYQPYEQGYQAPQETYQEGGQQYPVTETYDQYEQPQAQYPEQMPPMQQ
jgi:hypothetical protein